MSAPPSLRLGLGLGSIKSRLAPMLDVMNMDKLQERMKAEEVPPSSAAGSGTTSSSSAPPTATPTAPSSSAAQAGAGSGPSSTAAPSTATGLPPLLPKAPSIFDSFPPSSVDPFSLLLPPLPPSTKGTGPAAVSATTTSGPASSAQDVDTASAAEQALLADLREAGITYSATPKAESSSQWSGGAGAGAGGEGGALQRRPSSAPQASFTVGPAGPTDGAEVLARLVPAPMAAAATSGALFMGDAMRIVAGAATAAADRIGAAARDVPIPGAAAAFLGAAGRGALSLPSLASSSPSAGAGPGRGGLALSRIGGAGGGPPGAGDKRIAAALQEGLWGGGSAGGSSLIPFSRLTAAEARGEAPSAGMLNPASLRAGGSGGAGGGGGGGGSGAGDGVVGRARALAGQAYEAVAGPLSSADDILVLVATPFVVVFRAFCFVVGGLFGCCGCSPIKSAFRAVGYAATPRRVGIGAIVLFLLWLATSLGWVQWDASAWFASSGTGGGTASLGIGAAGDGMGVRAVEGSAAAAGAGQAASAGGSAAAARGVEGVPGRLLR
jgi:hypothetical protein